MTAVAPSTAGEIRPGGSCWPTSSVMLDWLSDRRALVQSVRNRLNAALRVLLLRCIKLSMRSERAVRLAAKQHDQPFVRWVWGFMSRAARHGVNTIATGPASGLRIDAGGSHVAYAVGNAEEHVQRVLVERLRPGMTVLDIGGNVGFISLLSARIVGSNGLVVALEPVPDNAARLRQNAQLNGFSNIRVIEVAASDRNEAAQMYVSDYIAFSRLTTTTRPRSVVQVIGVSARTVDDLVADGSVPPPHLVKIDVEGAELSVLNGMREVIARHRPEIVCEVHDCNVEYASVMRELDYVVTNLDDEDVPVERGHRNAHTLGIPIERAGGVAGATHATRGVGGPDP